MSGKKHREKGSRVEREIVKLLQESGFAAERVPLSGAARGRFGGDVSVPFLGIDRRVEVKARRNFKQIYGWLADHDFLVIRANHSQPLIVMRLSFAAEIAKIAEKHR